MERTDKFCVAQTWKSEFHVSIFTCLMLLATSLVMPTCSWESVGFGIFTVGVSARCVFLRPKQESLYCSWYICKGCFPTNFTHSEWKHLPAGRSKCSEGSFRQLCTCSALRSVHRMEGRCYGGAACSQAQLMDWPRQLAATYCFLPNRYKKSPKTQHWSSWLGRKEGMLL